MISASMILGCLLLGADAALIAAIIEQESDGQVAALNVNGWHGDPVPYSDHASSVASAEFFVERGYSVDVGLMGINSNNLQRFNQSIDSAYEPCTNIQLGERILMENIGSAKQAGYRGEQATRVALSVYNTGSLVRGFKNGYVDRVWARYLMRRTDQARTASLSVPWIRADNWSDRLDASRRSWVNNHE